MEGQDMLHETELRVFERTHAESLPTLRAPPWDTRRAW
jgi:hypothetical protein